MGFNIAPQEYEVDMGFTLVDEGYYKAIIADAEDANNGVPTIIEKPGGLDGWFTLTYKIGANDIRYQRIYPMSGSDGEYKLTENFVCLIGNVMFDNEDVDTETGEVTEFVISNEMILAYIKENGFQMPDIRQLNGCEVELHVTQVAANEFVPVEGDVGSTDENGHKIVLSNKGVTGYWHRSKDKFRNNCKILNKGTIAAMAPIQFLDKDAEF